METLRRNVHRRHRSRPDGEFEYSSNGYLTKLTFPSGSSYPAYVRYAQNAVLQNIGNNNYVWVIWVCCNVEYRYLSSDGTGPSEKTTRWQYFPDTTNRIVTDPVGGSTTYAFSGGLNSSETLNGRVIEKSGSTGTNARVQSVKTTINGMVKESTFQYDSYNNVTRQDDYDWGSGARGPLLRYITRTYAGSPYTDAHVYNKRTEEAIYSASGALISRTLLGYDTQSLVPRTGTIPGWVDPGMPRGNLTLLQRWNVTTSQWIPTTNQYDVLGNMVSTTDPGTHATTTDFTDRFIDANGNPVNPPNSYSTYAYPTRVTDPAGFYADTSYDFNTGLTRKVADSLARITTTTYDLMNRPLQVNLPNGGWTRNIYDDVEPKTTTEKLVDSQGNLGRAIHRFDKLYRETPTFA